MIDHMEHQLIITGMDYKEVNVGKDPVKQTTGSLKNFIGIDVSENKKYRFTEDQIKIHSKYGIYFYENFDAMNKSEKLAEKMIRVLK